MPIRCAGAALRAVIGSAVVHLPVPAVDGDVVLHVRPGRRASRAPCRAPSTWRAWAASSAQRLSTGMFHSILVTSRDPRPGLHRTARRLRLERCASAAVHGCRDHIRLAVPPIVPDRADGPGAQGTEPCSKQIPHRAHPDRSPSTAMGFISESCRAAREMEVGRPLEGASISGILHVVLPLPVPALMTLPILSFQGVCGTSS